MGGLKRRCVNDKANSGRILSDAGVPPVLAILTPNLAAFTRSNMCVSESDKAFAFSAVQHLHLSSSSSSVLLHGLSHMIAQ
jgi:hypothetical protein